MFESPLQKEKTIPHENKEVQRIEGLEKLIKTHPDIFNEHSFLAFELKKLINADLESFEHTRRVFDYAKLVGEKILNEQERKYLEIGALAHDIAKANEEILTVITDKKALTVDGFEILKKHPRIAHDICKKNGAYMAGDIAVRSHEHQAQRSYPRSEKDRRIVARNFSDRRSKNEVADRLSRILAIIDVFDALVSKRHYKKPTELREVIFKLREQFATREDAKVIGLIVREYNQIKHFDM